MESSKQLQRFEELFVQIEKLHSYHFSVLSKRLACVKLIEDLTVVREEIEYNIEKRKEVLLLDIDIDFNYEDIAEDSRWQIMNSNEKSLIIPNKFRSSYGILKEEVVNREHQQKTLNSLDIDEKLVTSNDVFDDINFVEALLQIGSKAIVSEGMLIALVNAAIKKLKERMLELGKLMKNITDKQCKDFYNDLISGWSYKKLYSKVKGEFEDWKIKHSPDESQIISKDMLKDYLVECMVELFKTCALKDIDRTLSRAEAAKYEQDLDFSGMSLDEATCKQQYKLLMELFKRKPKKKEFTYSPNEQKIGKHLYLHRKTITAEKREVLFRFIAISDLIQAEMNKPKTDDEKELNVEAPFIIFEREYLPKIMSKLKDDEGKRDWIIAYCEALKLSNHAKVLASDWQKKNKRQKVIATIIAGLIEVGLLPNNNQAATIAVSENEVNTFAKYIGDARRTEIAEWAKEYLKDHPLSC